VWTVGQSLISINEHTNSLQLENDEQESLWKAEAEKYSKDLEIEKLNSAEQKELAEKANALLNVALQDLRDSQELQLDLLAAKSRIEVTYVTYV